MMPMVVMADSSQRDGNLVLITSSAIPNGLSVHVHRIRSSEYTHHQSLLFKSFVRIGDHSAGQRSTAGVDSLWRSEKHSPSRCSPRSTESRTATPTVYQRPEATGIIRARVDIRSTTWSSDRHARYSLQELRELSSLSRWDVAAV